MDQETIVYLYQHQYQQNPARIESSLSKIFH